MMRTCLLVLFVAACGTKSPGGPGDVDAPPGGGIDASGSGGIDAATSACGTTQCSDCLDNDSDGRIDGLDIECTGAADNDEAGFATGIPGDNIDRFNQDCFFDGNSGAGNDGCNRHSCCLLGFTTVQQCNDYFDALGVTANPGFDPDDCAIPVSQDCIDNCAPAAPPGCDCFGCCTICDPATDVCRDVYTNPAVAPNCDETTLADPAMCPVCTKVEACDTPCDPANCILCPGQDPTDLPPGCQEVACPIGSETCDAQTPCPPGDYCSNGCCVFQIE